MLHIRLSRIAAEPPALGECVAYIEREVRPALEGLRGNLGISVLADREEGAAIFGSVWASSHLMSASEDTEGPLRLELARRAGGPVTAEDYEIAVFLQEAQPRSGQAVRLTRIQVKPSQALDVIEVIGDIAVPSLAETPGFCGALLFADPESGRLISETVWRDPDARAAAPSVAAIIRAEVPDEAASEIRAVADYSLVFSSVQEPE
jgi:heme-degrading monooxygenase HmoA